MERKIECGKTYRHFKGTLHQVIAIAKHTETLEELVIYTHDDAIWARPYDMFNGKVDFDKYPDATQEYRFEEVSKHD